VKEIPLTKGYVALVDDEDYEELSKYHWQAFKRPNGVIHPNRVGVKGEPHTISMARHILKIKDRWTFADHIDRNPLNNTRANLRIVTPKQSSKNRGRQRQKKWKKGVSFAPYMNIRNPWIASIKLDRKSIHLGYHETEELAYAAYCEAAKKYHGEFACLT